MLTSFVIPLGCTVIRWVMTSDVNDAALFNAEPRILGIDTEPRLSFAEKKSLSPADTLTKRARAELKL